MLCNKHVVYQKLPEAAKIVDRNAYICRHKVQKNTLYAEALYFLPTVYSNFKDQRNCWCCAVWHH